MRIYIAGPMTGLPDFNYPAFNAAAAMLRAAGHQVENPAENPDPACKSWAGYMRLALAQLVTCDAIYLLKGWECSRGARIECELACRLNMKVLREDAAADSEVGFSGGFMRVWEALSRIANGTAMEGKSGYGWIGLVIEYQRLAANALGHQPPISGFDLGGDSETTMFMPSLAGNDAVDLDPAVVGRMEGQELPLSTLLNLESGFFAGRWVEAEQLRELVECCKERFGRKVTQEGGA